MGAKSFKVKVKKGLIELTDKNYKASGGQGVVYCKDGVAYKIYHDATKMIPVAKIQELSLLKRADILGPEEPLFDPKDMKPIGFTMPFVDTTEFLCKVFTRNFRDDKGITYQNIVDMVVGMQKTLEYVHSMKFLVVDYNEMNFLLGQDLKMVYHIDVDSWKTPSFPAAALMESVRDRKGTKGVFTELTDWFSFAVVTFQLYIGIHPYKGFHPDFSPAEWSKRMDLGVSVFNKDVTLPKSCQDFSVIPKKHLDWYKAVFVKGERSIPPYPDAVMVALAGRTVTSQGGFIVEEVQEFKAPIQKVYFFDGVRFVVTSEGVFKENDMVLPFQKKSLERTPFELLSVYGEEPLVSYLTSGNAGFFDLSKKLVGTFPAEVLMGTNGLVYTISNGELIEHSFERLGKLIHRTTVVSSICPSYRIFQGVVVQDDFMQCHLAIPYEKGLCANIHVKELDGYRIIDGKHEGKTTVLIAEKDGEYWEYILCFDDSFSKYSIKTDKVNSLRAINFIALPNGLNLLADDEKVVLFKDNTARKEIKNTPVDSSTRFYHNGMEVYFVDDKKIYRVRMS